ncbi:hypothetical protein ACOME3_008297 [Neoechinorhynchus agilis]
MHLVLRAILLVFTVFHLTNAEEPQQDKAGPVESDFINIHLNNTDGNDKNPDRIIQPTEQYHPYNHLGIFLPTGNLVERDEGKNKSKEINHSLMQINSLNCDELNYNDIDLSVGDGNDTYLDSKYFGNGDSDLKYGGIANHEDTKQQLNFVHDGSHENYVHLDGENDQPIVQDYKKPILHKLCVPYMPNQYIPPQQSSSNDQCESLLRNFNGNEHVPLYGLELNQAYPIMAPVGNPTSQNLQLPTPVQQDYQYQQPFQSYVPSSQSPMGKSGYQQANSQPEQLPAKEYGQYHYPIQSNIDTSQSTIGKSGYQQSNNQPEQLQAEEYGQYQYPVQSNTDTSQSTMGESGYQQVNSQPEHLPVVEYDQYQYPVQSNIDISQTAMGKSGYQPANNQPGQLPAYEYGQYQYPVQSNIDTSQSAMGKSGSALEYGRYQYPVQSNIDTSQSSMGINGYHPANNQQEHRLAEEYGQHQYLAQSNIDTSQSSVDKSGYHPGNNQPEQLPAYEYGQYQYPVQSNIDTSQSAMGKSGSALEYGRYQYPVQSNIDTSQSSMGINGYHPANNQQEHRLAEEYGQHQYLAQPNIDTSQSSMGKSGYHPGNNQPEQRISSSLQDNSRTKYGGNVQQSRKPNPPPKKIANDLSQNQQRLNRVSGKLRRPPSPYGLHKHPYQSMSSVTRTQPKFDCTLGNIFEPPRIMPTKVIRLRPVGSKNVGSVSRQRRLPVSNQPVTAKLDDHSTIMPIKANRSSDLASRPTHMLKKISNRLSNLSEKLKLSLSAPNKTDTQFSSSQFPTKEAKNYSIAKIDRVIPGEEYVFESNEDYIREEDELY